MVTLVVHDEGLCSSKAIAFIQSNSTNYTVNLLTFCYLELGAFSLTDALSLNQSSSVSSIKFR